MFNRKLHKDINIQEVMEGVAIHYINRVSTESQSNKTSVKEFTGTVFANNNRKMLLGINADISH